MNTWNLGYKKAKVNAKTIYSKIGRIPCPALDNEYIAFTNAGFNHLVRKGRIPRTRNEQKRRFALIPFLEQIIKNPKAILLYRRSEVKEIINRHGEQIIRKSTANFWTFMEKVDERMIKVVIRQIGTVGQKHFFSVMSDIVKTDIHRGYKIKKPSK